MRFTLDQITPIWTGVDSTTPAGHVMVHGTDVLGRQNVWLFVGDAPSDESCRGRVQLPVKGAHMATAYNAAGGFVGSSSDVAALLTRLTDRPA